MWAKNCGHDDCVITDGKGCCLCLDSLDQLPYLQAYDCYLKGIGFTESDLRERYHGICVECRKRMKSHHSPWLEPEISMLKEGIRIRRGKTDAQRIEN